MNGFDALHNMYKIITKAEVAGMDKHTARQYALRSVSPLPRESIIYQDRHQHVERAIANIYDSAD